MPNDPFRVTHRILDASANRASEGLRTLEEFARFLLDDASVSEKLKSLRHQLAAAMGRFPRQQLLAARDTTGDVGTGIRSADEYRRESLADVVAAAASRTQQSLRVLEEYGKTIDPKFASAIEQVRYECYTVAASLELRVLQDARRLRLQASHLYMLIDARPSEQAFADMIARLATAGVDIFQLRDRSVDDRTLLGRARIGTEIARRHGALFIVNDRPDLAVAADADGVHVGQDEMPADQTRQIVGHGRLIGVSTHSIEQAREAVADGADYIGCGPVFASRTKSFESHVGTDLVRRIADEIALPAFAIGGIDTTNVAEVIDAGVRRIAVTGAIRDADDPGGAAAILKRELLGSSVE